MKKDLVDWNQSPLQRWIGSITRETTRRVYKSGWRLYTQHTGMTASQLIDEALEDAKRDPREKTDIVKRRLIGFYNWLIEEAPKRRGPKGKEVSKGLSSKISHTYVNAVRSFYGTFGVFVKLKGRSRLPRARVVNKRMILTNMDVKKLIEHAKTPRDRAIILILFQGGMDVSTLCDLKYGDVARGIKQGDHPLKLDLYRGKTGTEYYTFLGRDAVEGLRAYLNNVKARGIKHNPNTPLFLKLSHKALAGEGITSNLVQNMMRELAQKSGFVDENLNGRDFNPLSPHALRESFGSIMINKGVPDTIVDFWLGHEIGEMAEAYKRARFEELKRMYLEREPHISISQQPALLEEVEKKVRMEVEDRNRQLQTLVNGLAADNLQLKKEFEKMKGYHGALKKDHDFMKLRLSQLNRVIDIIDYAVQTEEDVKDLLDFFERKFREREAEDWEHEQKENAEILKKLRKEGKI